MKNDYPTLISVLIALLLVCAIVVATGDGGNKNIALILLALCGLITNALLRNQFALRRDLEKINQNANLLRTGQTLMTGTVAEPLAILDESIKQIRIDFNELSRREQSLIAQALDVICAIGPDQTFKTVNPASKKVLGYEPDELIGMKFTDIVVEEDRLNSLEASLGAARSVDVLNFENRVLRKDGSMINVLWSAHWSAAEKELFCVAHDITARKTAEKLLAESESRIRNIIEILPVGLLISNDLGIIESANQTIVTLAGYDAAELVGTKLNALLPELMSATAPPEFSKLVGNLTDTRLKLRSGEFCAVQVTASKLILNSYSCFLLAVVDSNEKEKLEQVKREFFAMVNHDLRAPLTSLLSVFDALNEGALGTLSEHGIDVIDRNSGEVGRLIKLVDELLDIEKMNAGKFEIEAEYSAVDSIVEASISAVQHLAQRHKIALNYTAQSHYVYADRSLLIRVLINLLSNAVKFSPPNSTVEIDVLEETESIHFKVTDRGAGVPKEFHATIFEKYKQVQSSSDQKKQGTGLGLPICKMIVEQHGGRIWLESETGKGSSFHFTIPQKAE